MRSSTHAHLADAAGVRDARVPEAAPPPGVLLFRKRGGRQLRCHFVTRAHFLPLDGKHRLAP